VEDVGSVIGGSLHRAAVWPDHWPIRAQTPSPRTRIGGLDPEQAERERPGRARGQVIQRTANPLNDQKLSPQGVIDLIFNGEVTDELRVSLGASNLLHAYPDTVKLANRGAPAFKYFNA
jgi:hypothetical protein